MGGCCLDFLFSVTVNCQSIPQVVLDTVRAVAGAGGLPDWNRSFEDGFVPIAITRESLQRPGCD